MSHLVADPQFNPHFVSIQNVASEILEPSILTEVAPTLTILIELH